MSRYYRKRICTDTIAIYLICFCELLILVVETALIKQVRAQELAIPVEFTNYLLVLFNLGPIIFNFYTHNNLKKLRGGYLQLKHDTLE